MTASRVAVRVSSLFLWVHGRGLGRCWLMQLLGAAGLSWDVQIAWRRAHTTSIIGKIRTTNNLPYAEVPKLSPGQTYEFAVAAVTDAGACRVPRSCSMAVPRCVPSNPDVLTLLLLRLASPCVCACASTGLGPQGEYSAPMSTLSPPSKPTSRPTSAWYMVRA